MATEATLSDVIERLRAEGQLTRNTGTNSIKSVKVELSEQTSALREMLKLMVLQEERAKLGRASQDTNEPGAGNSGRGRGDGDSSPPDDQLSMGDVYLAELMSSLTSLFGSTLFSKFSLLAASGAALAVTIGTTIGVVKGQMKATSIFFRTFTPELVKIFDNLKIETAKRFADILSDLKIRAAFIRGAMVDAFGKFAKFFTDLFPSSPDSKIAKAFKTIKKGMDVFIEPFTDAAKAISKLVGTGNQSSKIVSTIMSIGGWFSDLGKIIGKIAGVVGKIFAPIAILMTAFDTVRGIIQGYAEGGLLGALEGGVTGFFNSLIFGPLDLLKNVVSWVTGKLGFENFAAILDSFSFSELFSGLVSAIFDGVSSVISVVTDLFTFSEEDMTAFGMLGKLTDLVFLGVNSAINFVMGMFGFETEDGEPFKLQNLIWSTIDNVVAFFTDLFDFLPSLDEIKQTLVAALPEWMQPDSIEEQRQALADQIAEEKRQIAEGDQYSGVYGFQTNREDTIKELEAQVASLQGYRKGSNGFKDFGQGSLAMLHGIEAVVPRNTPAGEFLAKNFDDNLRPIMGRIANVENAAMNSASIQPVIITNAPTITPINNNVTGPTSIHSQRVTALGNGSGGSGLGRFAN
jgi:hypothetical protein